MFSLAALASFVAASAGAEDEAGCERRPLFAKRQFSNPDLHEALGAGTRATAEETLLNTVRAATNTSGAMILVDVGANRGDFAQLLLERWPSAELHVFEVLTPHVARLRARFANAPQVHVHHNAVSDVNSGTADIRGLPEWAADRSAIDGSVTGASLFTRSRRRRSYTAVVETVPLTTLDATLMPLLTGGGGRGGVPFLKVDAEGADPQVLLGARRLLEAGVVEVVYFENNVLQRQGGHSLYRTVRYLHGLGYVTYYVGRQAQLLPLTRLCHSHAVFADKGASNVVAARSGSAVLRALTSRLRVWS
jgi:FkbM family methyltransferase